jgi:flagellum-specific ATP synthase
MTHIIGQLNAYLTTIAERVDNVHSYKVHGTIIRISGFLLEATGLNAAVGMLCYVATPQRQIPAEVIGFSNQKTYLMAYQDTLGISPGNKLYCTNTSINVPVGEALQGRIINGLCEPIDNKGGLNPSNYYSLYAPAINPIERNRITAPLDVGIKAINALLTVGQGQRLGIFAGSGVGKSVLLGMMSRFTAAEVVVVGLIGERGREVKEFIEDNIGEENLKKTVVIAAPIDSSPLERANGALAATSIAEYFRDSGRHVLLIVDSLTRYAQALRQIYLTLGEMPSSKGYSPTVFAKISQLVERTGSGCGQQGSITAFYTVLTEGDDMNDPVADHARSILDGHIVLSRQLADSGHYPAIDIGSSVSRVMSTVIDKPHFQQAQRLKQLYSAYIQNQDLIKMGMYQRGSDQTLDEAILFHSKIKLFLQQATDESSAFEATLSTLMGLFE